MSGYTVNEIFYSLQGEGVRTGTANAFVRFTGCNLTCRQETHGFDCDTEFTSGRKMSAEEILAEVKRIGGPCRSAILTGGEPGLQLDAVILSAFRDAGYFIAIETNGTVSFETLAWLIDWISLSPKVAEHAVRQPKASELRYVRSHGQGIPKPSAEAEHYLISPAFDGDGLSRENLKWCIDLVKQNPKWRLSIQNHKSWAVR
jgi:organic radical activating enzyme